MKKINFKEIITPILSLFIIAVVTTALLALTNFLTTEKINEISLENENTSRLSLFPEAESFIKEDGYYSAIGKDGGIIGYTFDITAKGYGGDISVMVGIDMASITTNNKSNITGVVIIEHSETPGLGANCSNDSFTAQFLQPLPDGGFTVVKNAGGGDNGKIDAITGATISTNAVTSAVNEAVRIFEEVILKGGDYDG